MSQTTTKAQFALPAAAAGVGITNNGVSLANSTYVEVSAALPADSILLGMLFSNSSASSPSAATFEVDVAVGAAAAEVVKATLRGTRSSAGGQAPMNSFPIPIDAFPAGSRVAVRLRYQSATTTPGLHQVTLFFLLK